MPSMLGQIPSTTPDTDLQLRIPAKNVGSSDIDAYGVAEITDTKYDSIFGTMYLEIRTPTSDSVKTVVVNTEAPIEAGGFGQVSPTFPTWVKYDSADGVPALNEQWGPASGTCLAKKGKIGFLAIPLASGVTPPRTDLAMMMLEVCRA